MLQLKQIRHITIVAEGVPGSYTRHSTQLAKETNVVILDPSTADGLKLESWIGNTGGMLNNIVSSKLFRPGSGGLSIELSNMLSFLHTAFFLSFWFSFGLCCESLESSGIFCFFVWK